MADDNPRFLKRDDGPDIAYHRHAGDGARPGVVFLGGYASDMTGTKATALEAFCRARGQGFLRFDYQAHGATGGSFEACTIGTWLDDALAAFDALTEGPQVVVGSSMGGWIMVLLALARRARIRGLIGIAAAPDFTEDLIWETLPAPARETLERTGRISRPNQYSDEPYIITRKLIEDGRKRLVLRETIDLDCPVRLIHGVRDADVPWQVSLKLAGKLAGDDVRLTLIKDGEHRLSREGDLALIQDSIAELCAN